MNFPLNILHMQALNAPAENLTKRLGAVKSFQVALLGALGCSIIRGRQAAIMLGMSQFLASIVQPPAFSPVSISFRSLPEPRE
jgi:hypothetical protein